MIPDNSSVINAFNNNPLGTSFSHSLKASHANGLSVVTTNGAQPFVPYPPPPPPPPTVLVTSGVTIKYTGPALTSTTIPAFYQANLRGTGMEWFAVVDQNFKQKISDYANTNSGNYAAAVATFTPPGQSSPVIFNNIVTTLMTDMNFMFVYAVSFNTPLYSWDVSNVTDMGYMFFGASSFNQPLNSWIVSNVTSMSAMFANASSFNQDISNWNVSNVTNMGDMFNSASSFNCPLNNWNVSKVTNMSFMFMGCFLFNQDISNWIVSNVTSMYNMFANASSFNQPIGYDSSIGSWNVSKVTNMSYMFYGASAFNQNISNWDVANVTDHENFIDEQSLLLSHSDPSYIPNWVSP